MFFPGFLPVVEKLGFKNVAEINLRDKVVNFVAACDGDLVLAHSTCHQLSCWAKVVMWVFGVSLHGA